MLSCLSISLDRLPFSFRGFLSREVRLSRWRQTNINKAKARVIRLRLCQRFSSCQQPGALCLYTDKRASIRKKIIKGSRLRSSLLPVRQTDLYSHNNSQTICLAFFFPLLNPKATIFVNAFKLGCRRRRVLLLTKHRTVW